MFAACCMQCVGRVRLAVVVTTFLVVALAFVLAIAVMVMLVFVLVIVPVFAVFILLPKACSCVHTPLPYF